MTFQAILENLKKQYPVSGYTRFGCNFIESDLENFKAVISTLKGEYGFSYMVDVVASHWPKRAEKFEVTYNIYSIPNNVRAFVKVKLVDPVIPTITDIYKGADFMEREQYDLVGVTFEGHPNMKRILLPDFFEGHPLRKDYKLKDRSWFNKADEQGLGISFKK